MRPRKGVGELREGSDRAEYEREGLKAKLQCSQRGRKKCVDSVSRP